jgi:ectoine hydroxylase-related dioxygenase (phytanoyl-CoA dioxygenase family)
MATTLDRTAARLSPRRELEEKGFVRFEQALDRVTVDTLLLRAHATLFRESAEDREAVKSNGSMCHLADSPEFADIIASPAILAALREVGATDPRFTGGYLISKPAGGPPLFWHQDWWGWTEPESYTATAHQLFAMIYLTDTSVENGCLRVIPGTHRHDHELHHLEAAHSRGLAAFSDPTDPAYGSHPDEVPVPVRAGDILIGDARLIHSAYGNRTQQERPLLTLWYMPHWSSMSPGMRALAWRGYMRGDDIPTSSVRRPLTFLDWPQAILDRVRHLLPPDDGGGAAPIPWHRIPDTTKLLPPER